MDGTAVVICDGFFQMPEGKTAHGLVRETDRYKILGVIDGPTAGQDAGVVLDGLHRAIPIYPSLQQALKALPVAPDYCIVGIATRGGRLTASLREQLLVALEAGMSVVNGLHEFAADDPKLAQAAAAQGRMIIDIRRPKPKEQLHFWSGAIRTLGIPRIAVLGTDCALGKRTTSRFLLTACNRAGIRTQLIYTGQTGWLQGTGCGFVLDAVVNDFVSGEIEYAILECARRFEPELILLEGQSALRNPAGPCGSEFILSGGAAGVILQHAPGRLYFDGFEEAGYRIPPIQEEIALIELLGAQVLAVTINSAGLGAAQLADACRQLQAQLMLPVVRPLEDGVEGLVAVIERYIASQRAL
ncbi:DUF1611 domain-containing protein [Gloeobacter kilaueensis]|uniref:DUF1611 domain-containing protein n=1 Tax=Gloeobacter kilaueensis (strain ATCC BAA-2537 / CCAP 1431/1 / ULC 316 / JS1) TaxID=1183438 RepID=U5QP52_GLOK1|nr:DUF1611 domain-containing protein [Gloeobacter kilaueensis]AGY59430.1 hypothetical protein GKIL_3184 [Gloeobacter kilaueensis JS1]